MPAALILDDSSYREMLSLARVGGEPNVHLNNHGDPISSPAGDNMTCEQLSSRASTPPFVVPDCDMEITDTTSASNVTTNTHQALHLLSAALDILNAPSAEILDFLAVLRALPYEPDIQRMACERLWVESFEDDEALRLAQEGGIALVTTAMARFPHDVRLQHCAAEVLQNIAALEDEWYAHELCERGAVELLIGAMKNHNKHYSLQLCGCTTMASLAEVSVAHQDYIRRVGGVEAIRQAQWFHGTHPAVVEGARQALEALGCNQEDDDDDYEVLEDEEFDEY